ncbi:MULTISPECIES: hypothetical protein [unclassified Ancylobacter]|uniref:hypothetical protein n=1 Tax=unclassified Ancylobacter TaxID=2626613 RepID=UPI00226E0092|nr:MULTISPECIES: hypothetical protein [unclassified Ancylobacter]WAC26821.1 hypothetical protein OU996_17695 [Ancylobacter sp. SL191]WGD30817.1 hypothetical protein AncyloWKF20_02970 [Ancylobacter sp. WKF20]
MTAPHSLLPPLLSKIDALIAAEKYQEVAEAYTAFVTEHATTNYLASEPIPFKLNVAFSKKYGSSATNTFTLRHTTWASDVKAALKAGPGDFAALVAKYEAEVAELAKSAKKVA